MNRLKSLLLACGLALAAPAGFAQPVAAAPPQPLDWSSLTSEQQKSLGSFQNRWAQLPPARQQALLRGSERWDSMSPSSVRRPGSASRDGGICRRWSARSCATAGSGSAPWPPEQQRQMRQNFRKFQQLPPERRRALRERWRKATPEQRQRMLQRLDRRESRDRHEPPETREQN